MKEFLFTQRKAIVESELQKMKVSRCCVQKTLKRFEESGSHSTEIRSGRPKKTSKRLGRETSHISLSNRRYTAEKIRSVFNQNKDVQISTSTIKERLKKFGLQRRLAARKPLLRPIRRKV